MSLGLGLGLSLKARLTGGGGGGPAIAQLNWPLVADGDSINGKTQQNSFREWALAYTGGKFYLPPLYSQAAGGQSSAQGLAGFSDVTSQIVAGQTTVLMGPWGANDYSLTPAQTKTNIQAMITAATAAGARQVVLVPTLPYEIGAPGIPVADMTQRTADAYTLASTMVTVVDVSGFNPVTMKDDYIHPNAYGAEYLGWTVAQVLLGQISAASVLPTAASGDNILGADWEFPGAVAISGISGVSGVKPTNWTPSRNVGTGAWVLSKGTMVDGYNALVANITAAPDQTRLKLTKTITISGAIGDLFDAYVELEITGTKLQGIEIDLGNGMGWNAYNPSSLDFTLPRQAIVLRVPANKLTATGSAMSLAISVQVGTGGSLQAKFGRAYCRFVGSTAGVLAITGSPVTLTQVGQAASFSPTITGGTAPYSLALATGSAALPAGWAITGASPTFSVGGTATTVQSLAGIVLQVTDSLGAKADMTAFSTQVTAAGTPVNTVAPAITGTGAVGSALTCSTGTWSNTPTGYAYQWYSDGHLVTGATANTFTPAAGDVGQPFTCGVTASNGSGSGAEKLSSNAVTIASGSDETETTTLVATMVAQGATPFSAPQKAAINTFYVGAKASTWWAKVKAFYLYRNTGLAAAKIDLTDQATIATQTGTPNFLAGSGLRQGSLTLGVNVTTEIPQNELGLTVWYSTIDTGAGYDLVGSPAGTLRMRKFDAGSGNATLNGLANASANITDTRALATGFTHVQRISSSQVKVYGTAGTLLATIASTSVAPTATEITALNTGTRYLGAVGGTALLSDAETLDYASKVDALVAAF